MRRHIGKPLRQSFEQRLRKIYGSVEPDDDAEVPDTMCVFRVDAGERVIFVSLQLHRTQDAFTVEIAWAPDDKYPAFARLGGPPDRPTDQARFRIRQLWEGTGSDKWWEINLPPTMPKAELKERIEAVLNGALERVEKEALPFALSRATPPA